MGFPLGAILTNVLLCHSEKDWLDNCPSHFKPIVYRSYVDNSFALFRSKEYLLPFVDYMNKQHRCIKFSSETEQNNSFFFRDINVTVKITNLKHLLIKNLLSVLFLHTMKVTLINLRRIHWSLLYYFAVTLYAGISHCSISKLKN